jgi:hypothetical protein
MNSPPSQDLRNVWKHQNQTKQKLEIICVWWGDVRWCVEEFWRWRISCWDPLSLVYEQLFRFGFQIKIEIYTYRLLALDIWSWTGLIYKYLQLEFEGTFLELESSRAELSQAFSRRVEFKLISIFHLIKLMQVEFGSLRKKEIEFWAQETRTRVRKSSSLHSSNQKKFHF